MESICKSFLKLFFFSFLRKLLFFNYPRKFSPYPRKFSLVWDIQWIPDLLVARSTRSIRTTSSTLRSFDHQRGLCFRLFYLFRYPIPRYSLILAFRPSRGDHSHTTLGIAWERQIELSTDKDLWFFSSSLFFSRYAFSFLLASVELREVVSFILVSASGISITKEMVKWMLEENNVYQKIMRLSSVMTFLNYLINCWCGSFIFTSNEDLFCCLHWSAFITFRIFLFAFAVLCVLFICLFMWIFWPLYFAFLAQTSYHSSAVLSQMSFSLSKSSLTVGWSFVTIRRKEKSYLGLKGFEYKNIVSG